MTRSERMRHWAQSMLKEASDAGSWSRGKDAVASELEAGADEIDRLAARVAELERELANANRGAERNAKISLAMIDREAKANDQRDALWMAASQVVAMLVRAKDVSSDPLARAIIVDAANALAAALAPPAEAKAQP